VLLTVLQLISKTPTKLASLACKTVLNVKTAILAKNVKTTSSFSMALALLNVLKVTMEIKPLEIANLVLTTVLFAVDLMFVIYAVTKHSKKTENV